MSASMAEMNRVAALEEKVETLLDTARAHSKEITALTADLATRRRPGRPRKVQNGHVTENH